MRHALILSLALLTGCSNCVTLMPGTPAVAGPAAVAPGQQPAAAATRQASIVDGTARYFGAALAGATVTAYIVGKTGSVGTATTGTDGTFHLELAAGVPQGALVEVIAALGSRRVVNVTAAPARRTVAARRVLEATDFVLDAGQTAALMLLYPRLVALQASSSDADKAAALAALDASAQALGSSGSLLGNVSFDAVVARVIDGEGRVGNDAPSRDAVAAAIPVAAVAVIVAQADKLAALIRADVQAGAPRPDGTLLGPLPIGEQVAVEVFPQAPVNDTPVVVGDTPGGLPTDNTPANQPGSATVDLSASPADGTYGTPAAPVSGEAR